MTTERFQVPGISCQHCVNAITREVSAVPGVKTVAVALENKTVTVEHSDDINAAAIVAAINEAGYDEVAQM